MLRDEPSSPVPPPTAPTPEDSEGPTWVQKLDDRLKTIARAQSKLSLRLDEFARDVEQRFERVLTHEPPAKVPALLDPTPVLDAIDRLDDACRMLSSHDRGVTDGLRTIGARLEGFLGSMGVERRTDVGTAPDPRLYRVVGTEATSEAPDGITTRVVRSAALRGRDVLREGEVLVSRRTP